ncbi:TPA: hypothetical protein MCW73_001441 [Klebsiella pneumoniae]|uniref:hypothetical protein n=1 Tax=Klebsiella pneumoniae TaxID=573 RepID=UPI000C7C8EAA|nr:hypothetical protein [Klebsiella pneumoniae]MBZ1869082.1 hypothetical protein [Klebsiella pneumoniae]PLE76305.1 hypothetical protein B6I77_05760 [Klebsiella pneumoniae]PLH13803.1 hypothetical protein B6J23_23345 [Klebsiella pneumoniae]QPV93351.1 hypothetical protein I8N74_06475 [Klebsiella pneumoniae]HBT7661924.1 hypothetical protein [Klebsiella pneumoniae]
MKKIKLFFGLTLSIVSVNAATASSLQCNKDNFNACKTCEQLSKAIDLKEPNRGDYYRGALWNGLYTSYVINCPVVAEKLLSHGAIPSYGGYMGAMGAVLTGKWPHNNESINLSWADLLIKHGLDVNKHTGDYKSATEVWAVNEKQIEYKSVFNKLIQSSEVKPLDPSRNLEWCASEGYRSVVVYSLNSCIKNAIKRLDDGVSSASDISSAAVNACAGDVANFKKHVACKSAIKEQSDKERSDVYQLLTSDSQMNKNVIDMLKERNIEKVLEFRAEKRSMKTSQ